jgi:hypothetical protein
MAKTNTAGGVCNINPIIPPQAKGPPTLPSIPTATNLQTALQAIAALTQIVYALTNQSGGQGGYGNQGGQFIVLPNPGNGSGTGTGTGTGTGNQSNPNSGNFTEVKNKRVIQEVTVSNPQDSSQYVKVKNITSLTFIDSRTGQQITWTQ